ncbi:hypothetical protein [Aureimonas sp. SK2]|uniref:hypothetical protein n=1 Tax=Aureimonas sp. SK2 TaxID=3015992 RepID=UPI002443C43B|nr:hypothetical protein [Aureimonas sp. SK2]
MPHLRTLVRTAVIDRLKAAVPSVGGRVHAGSRKLRDFQAHDLPMAVVVVSETAPSDHVGNRPRRVRRNIVVEVELVVDVGTTDDLEAALDDASVEVEAALAGPDFLPFTVAEWRLTTTSPGFGAGGGDAVYGVLTLSYALAVTSTEGRPDTHR